MSNWEIINRCEDFLSCTRDERWEVDGQVPKKIGDALFHIAGLVLQDMQFLAQMGDAGLGHGAGPQVRRLLEVSTVVWDMQEHDDAVIADAASVAWQEARSFDRKQINRSRAKLNGEHSNIAQKISQRWGEYNSESHFNLRERVLPESGPGQVQHGIAMGYIVINELALFREKHLPCEYKTERTSMAEALLDEVGLALTGDQEIHS